MSVHAASICLVTVTYGRRWNLLRQALASAFREGVTNAIIVDNGSVDDIAAGVSESFGPRAKVVRLGSNMGSALAFKTGLEAAVACDAQLILLMDDDNSLDPGALTVLKEALEEISRASSLDNVMAVGFRPDHQRVFIEAIIHGHLNFRASGFLGFDVTDLRYSLYRRLPSAIRRRSIADVSLQKRVSIPYAPYGGMLFHRSVLARHGYPDPRFVLYGDDTEFSDRFVQNGGTILLDTRAALHDLELSWNAPEKPQNVFRHFLLGSANANARVFYTVRNTVYWSLHRRKHSRTIRMINRTVFLSILSVMSWCLKRRDRYDLLRYAIRQGEAGNLGFDEKMPL